MSKKIQPQDIVAGISLAGLVNSSFGESIF
jgi:hypothetical protein